MKVLLDTDITSYLFGRFDERVLAHFKGYAAGDVGISAITAAELAYGVARNASTRNRKAVDLAFESLVIAPFTRNEVHEYAQLRLALEKVGTPIGSHDMLIAAHALSLGVPLATNNAREFRRVPGLRVENWLT